MNAPPTPDVARLSSSASAFHAALDARSAKATISRDTLFEVFGTVVPHLDDAGARRVALAAALDELAEKKVVQTPKERHRWDAGRPALPATIRLRRPAAARHTPPAMVWRPELAWASTVHLAPSQIEHLKAVNRWLRDTSTSQRAREPLPMRERSYEIFGDEKRLEALLATSLFAPGRLSLQLLHCFRMPIPLTLRTVSDASTILVVENSDTFHSVLSTLKDRPGSIGAVAYGSGQAFESSVADIGNLASVRRILYFGDLDAAGLAIPARASVTAQALGHPPVEPAAVLYTHLLKSTPGAGSAVERGRAEYLTEWLPVALRQRTIEILCSGGRIAQEAMNRRLLAQLRAHDDFGG